MYGTAYLIGREQRGGRPQLQGILTIEGPCRNGMVVSRYGPNLALLSEAVRPMPEEGITRKAEQLDPADMEAGCFYALLAPDEANDLLAIRKAVDRLNKTDGAIWRIEAEGMDLRIDRRDDTDGWRPMLLYTWKNNIYSYQPDTRPARHLLSALYRQDFHQNIWEPGTVEENIQSLRRLLNERGGVYETMDHLRRLSLAAHRAGNLPLFEDARRLAISVEDSTIEAANAAWEVIGSYETSRQRTVYQMSPAEIGMVAEGEVMHR